MKKLLFILPLTLFLSGCGTTLSDLIGGSFIIILWTTSATFRSAIVVALFIFLYKWVFKPQWDACDFNGRWTWWGRDSDLIDKPIFAVTGVLTFLVGCSAIYYTFLAMIA